MTTFKLVRSWHPPGPTSPTTMTMLPDVTEIHSPLALRLRLMSWAAQPRRLADKHFKAAPDCYKLDHDNKVRFEPTYMSSDYGFINMQSSSTSVALGIAAEGDSKKMLKWNGLYQVCSVGPKCFIHPKKSPETPLPSTAKHAGHSMERSKATFTKTRRTEKKKQ